MDIEKILLYDEQYGTKRHGGASTFVEKFATSTDHEVQIFSYRKSKMLSMLLFPYIREMFVYPVVFLLHKVPKDVDLIIFNSTFSTFLRKPKSKSVVIVHCLFTLQALKLKTIFSRPYQLPVAALGLICKQYEKKALTNVDVIISPREEIKDFLVAKLAINESMIKVIPQFVDRKYFHIKRSDKVYDLIFVGRLSKAKGFDDFCEFARSHKTLKLLVVTKSKIGNFNLDNVIYKVNVVQSELLKLYNSSRVLFMPSYSETGPLVTLEAMSCGIPVLATREGGGEFVESGVEGEIYNKFDKQSCYELYKKIIADYSTYSEHALEKSTLFDISKILNEYGTVFSHL